MSLIKGTIIYGTQLGHYNFHYPDESVTLVLPYDVESTEPSWRPATIGSSPSTFRAHKLHDEDAIALGLPSKVVWVMDIS